MTKLDGRKRLLLVALLCGCVLTAAASAQVVTTLADFRTNEGADPFGPLVQGRDGSFYGETDATLFRITPKGALTVLYRFGGGNEPSDPRGGLTLGTDGNFYGTTQAGGKSGRGTLFNVSPAGKLTTLYSFSENGDDGARPEGGLIEGIDGAFYGTTFDGGANECNDMNCGTVFKFTREGVFTTLHSFNFTDGAYPMGKLAQGRDGGFYGTTLGGGDLNCYVEFEQPGCGLVFRIDLRGEIKILHRFELNDGAEPDAGLIQGIDGNLYGTTTFGGNLECDPPFGCGTVFKITPGGKLTTIHKFKNAADGGFPVGQLVQATDGNLYGAAESSGTSPCSAHDVCGTLFRIVPGGAFTTLYSFCELEGCADGNWPRGGLIQGTDGLIYGTTFEGGDPTCTPGYGCGTVFTLNAELGSFVTLVRGYGKVGQTGGILGQGFTGTNSVTLKGVPAAFTVVSDNYIRATVPEGASSGYVTVATPSGWLTSNREFVVLK